MLSVSTLKVVNREELTCPLVSMLPWRNTGSLTPYVPAPPIVIYKGTLKCIGKKTSALLTRGTGKFKKGQIKLTPATHYSFNAGSTPGVPTRLYGYVNSPAKLSCMKELSGDVAAYIVGITPTNMSIPDVSNQEKTLVLSCIADYKSAEADVGMMLAEGGETIKMLISPIHALSGLTKKLLRPRNFRRSSKFKPGSALTYAASAWLQYRYGIMPFMADVDTIRNTTRSVLSPRDIPYRKTRKLKVLEETRTKYAFSAFGVAGCYVWGQYISEQMTIVRAEAFYRANLQSTGSQLGLDITSIPSLMYELIPFSFVLDWFLDVGTWLRAITPKAGISSLGTCTSVSSSNTMYTSTVHACASPTISAIFPASPFASSYVGTNEVYRRSLGTTLAQYPALGAGLDSFKRKTDSVSLLWQLMPKLPKR